MSEHENFDDRYERESTSSPSDWTEGALQEIFGRSADRAHTLGALTGAAAVSVIDWLPQVQIGPPAGTSQLAGHRPDDAPGGRAVAEEKRRGLEVDPPADDVERRNSSWERDIAQARNEQALRHAERSRRDFGPWLLEQSEVEATARLVAQVVRNSNGMLQPEQEAMIRAALLPRLAGSTSAGSHEQEMLQRIREETNLQLRGTGYHMIYDPGAISGAPMIRFDRHYEGMVDGRRYPATQPFLILRNP